MEICDVLGPDPPQQQRGLAGRGVYPHQQQQGLAGGWSGVSLSGPPPPGSEVRVPHITPTATPKKRARRTWPGENLQRRVDRQNHAHTSSYTPARRAAARVGLFECVCGLNFNYRPPNVLARRGELSARRLAPGGRWDERSLK